MFQFTLSPEEINSTACFSLGTFAVLPIADGVEIIQSPWSARRCPTGRCFASSQHGPEHPIAEAQRQQLPQEDEGPSRAEMFPIRPLAPLNMLY